LNAISEVDEVEGESNLTTIRKSLGSMRISQNKFERKSSNRIPFDISKSPTFMEKNEQCQKHIAEGNNGQTQEKPSKKRSRENFETQ